MNLANSGIAGALVVVLSAFLSIACATSSIRDPRSFERAPLYGMIYDLDNRPVGKARLTVDGKSSASSDVTGRFVLVDLTRGDHGIRAQKEGYEILFLSFSFLDDTQVLYLQMRSQQQLLTLAEVKIEEMEWEVASSLLERAALIDAKNPVYRYLSAVFDERIDRPRRAEATLLSLVAEGYTQPAVYLFLADLHQFALAAPDDAADDLRRYLELRSDPIVAKRLSEIERRSEVARPPQRGSHGLRKTP